MYWKCTTMHQKNDQVHRKCIEMYWTCSEVYRKRTRVYWKCSQMHPWQAFACGAATPPPPNP